MATGDGAADQTCGFLQCRLAPAGEGDAVTVRGQPQCGRAPDPRAGAGDDGDRTFLSALLHAVSSDRLGTLAEGSRSGWAGSGPPAPGGRPATSPRGPACLQLLRCCEEVLRGEGEAVEAGVVGVLVFDVDRHVRIDLGERGEELGPVGDVVPDTHCDELPAGVVRPGVDPEAVAGGHLARV